MLANVLILLLPVLAVSAVTVDPRCTRYSFGAEAQVLAHLQDCRKFVICDMGGNGQVLSCPPGLYFSDEAHTCSFDTIACTHGELDQTPETIPSLPVVPSLPAPVPLLPVVPEQPPQPLPVPEQPQPLPVIPSEPVPFVPPVVDGSEGVQIKPLFPNWLPIVTPPAPTVEEPVAEQGGIEQLPPQSVCWDKPMGQIYPIVHDCGLYVVCMGDRNAIVQRCPKGLLYDHRQQRCEFADAAYCATPRFNMMLDIHGVDLSLLEEEKQNEEEHVEEMVEAEEEVEEEVPAESYSVPVVAVKEHASPAVISEMVQHDYQPVQLAPEPEQPIVGYNFRLIDNHPRCLARSNMQFTVQLPHDTDCSKYLVCVGRVAIEKACPAGQHWNANNNWCDFASMAGCAL